MFVWRVCLYVPEVQSIRHKIRRVFRINYGISLTFLRCKMTNVCLTEIEYNKRI